MPKRSTQTYSSEDAPQTDEDVITVYYCKYSGDPVLITDAELGKLPKRRTDGARVLDTEKYTVRLKAQPEVKAKLIKREGGKLEKQYRYLMGDLPVCYKSEPEGKYLYLIDGALSAFNFGNTAGEGGETPVPPCIQQTASGMIQIAIDVEDKARTKAVSKITADEVGVALTLPVGQCDDELLEFVGKVLHLRLPQMSLLRGWSTRSKLLMVQGLSATQVYERLHKSMEENRKRIERLVNLHSADNKWLNKPEVEKLESIDPELAKQEIRAKDDMDAYDKFRVKGGAAQHRDPFAQKESGPTNIYKTQSKTAGSNWNDTKI